MRLIGEIIPVNKNDFNGKARKLLIKKKGSNIN
jgi:hypothetical protein